jgi:imidazole glycerol-phosphate synthase subunit HisH
MEITIVDFGMGNLGSIPNMLKRLGATARITSDPTEIAKAGKLILPGVGSFDAAMRNIESRGFIPVLRQKAFDERIPILGLCLGMELLADRSDEGRLPGLGWVPGTVVRFDPTVTDPPLRVPHMGWNTLVTRMDIPLLRDLGDEARFYFAHSYHFVCDDPMDIAATTMYGSEFTCAVQRDNVMGIQFHPEKSHRFGLRVFANFLAL